MAKEAFLINPPKRKTSRKKAKKRALPKSMKGKKRKRISVYKTGKKSYSRSPYSPSKQDGIMVNPYGEEVIVVGANPRKRRRKRKAVRRKRRNPVATRRTYKKRTRRNPVAKRRVYRKRRNPIAKRRTTRRRIRRNPAMAIGTMRLNKPMTFVMPVMTGVASAIATKKIPAMLNLTGNMRYLGQVAVGLIGGMILKKPLGAQNATIFAIVSLASTAQEVLAERVGGVFAGLSGFVDYEAGYTPELLAEDGNMMGDYATPDNYGAFVDVEDEGPF